jgi:hypothetical protein
MAELRRDGGDLVLHLSAAEKAEAVRGDLRVPVSAMRGVEVFVAVHGNTPRGVRVRLAGAPWDEWIVGRADPEAVAATLAPAG